MQQKNPIVLSLLVEEVVIKSYWKTKKIFLVIFHVCGLGHHFSWSNVPLIFSCSVGNAAKLRILYNVDIFLKFEFKYGKKSVRCRSKACTISFSEPVERLRWSNLNFNLPSPPENFKIFTDYFKKSLSWNSDANTSNILHSFMKSLFFPSSSKFPVHIFNSRL